MNALLEEAPALLVSLFLILATTVLLALGVLPAVNPLVTAIFVGVMSFWIGNGTARTTARHITEAGQPLSTKALPIATDKDDHIS